MPKRAGSPGNRSPRWSWMSHAAVLTTCHIPCRSGWPKLVFAGEYARDAGPCAASSVDATTATTSMFAQRVPMLHFANALFPRSSLQYDGFAPDGVASHEHMGCR